MSGLLMPFLVLVGCPTDPVDPKPEEPEESVFEQFCDRLDECNSTMLDGMSATECVDYFADCTDDLLESEARDVEAAAEECLAEQDVCFDFEDCYWFDVPYC